jgi:hypothetical protein
MHQYFTSFFMYLDRVFKLEISYGQMIGSTLGISVDNQMYSRRNKPFGMLHKF